MNLKLTFFALLLFCLTPVYYTNAQVGIGTTTPDQNAALDIASTTQGMLIPRMLKAQRELIGGGSPAAGMLVYQTDDAAGFYFYDGNAWVSLTTVKPSGLESVDEGNGKGLVRVGRNPDNYGNVGENAVDLSYSPGASTTYGATGFNSIAMGRVTIASGVLATAMGNLTIASGVLATAMGNLTIASGTYSTALGSSTQAESFAATAIGLFNLGGGSPDTIILTDPLFEIGNGTDFLNRNNALTVLKNGNIGIGASNPSDKLVIEGGRLEVLADIEASASQGTGSIEIANSLRIDGDEIISNFGLPLYLQQNNNGDLVVDNGTLYVDSSVNRVGIGTITPSHTLDVAGKAEINGDAYITGNVGISAASPNVKLHVSGGTDASLSANSGFVQIGETSGLNLVMDNNEIIARNNSGASSMYLQSGSGNLAIGAIVPTEKLDVSGNIRSRGNAYVDGRIGIGTTLPSQALDVFGNVEINGNTNVSGDVDAGGHLYGQRVAFTGFDESTFFFNSLTAYLVDFSTQVIDNQNTLSSNGTFTAPRSGLYFFSTSLSFSHGDGVDDTMWLGFSVNNSASMETETKFNPRYFTRNGQEQTYSYSAVISLNSGDTVRVLIRDATNPSPIRLLERTFTGYYLGNN